MGPGPPSSVTGNNQNVTFFCSGCNTAETAADMRSASRRRFQNAEMMVVVPVVNIWHRYVLGN